MPHRAFNLLTCSRARRLHVTKAPASSSELEDALERIRQLEESKGWHPGARERFP